MMEKISTSVLESHFDKKRNGFSPSCPTYDMHEVFAEDGSRKVVFRETDLQKEVIEPNGKYENWKLDSLLRAGINPSTGINTSPSSRIEVGASISKLADTVESQINVESEKTE